MTAHREGDALYIELNTGHLSMVGKGEGGATGVQGYVTNGVANV